jgi:hypothetical protein
MEFLGSFDFVALIDKRRGKPIRRRLSTMDCGLGQDDQCARASSCSMIGSIIGYLRRLPVVAGTD